MNYSIEDKFKILNDHNNFIKYLLTNYIPQDLLKSEHAYIQTMYWDIDKPVTIIKEDGLNLQINIGDMLKMDNNPDLYCRVFFMSKEENYPFFENKYKDYYCYSTGEMLIMKRFLENYIKE